MTNEIVSKDDYVKWNRNCFFYSLNGHFIITDDAVLLPKWAKKSPFYMYLRKHGDCMPNILDDIHQATYVNKPYRKEIQVCC